MPPATHFAHQSIVDRSGRVVAREVLFRADGGAAVATIADGARATREVLAALEEHGYELFGGVPAFVNFPRSLILDGTARSCDRRRVGIEILEDVAGDPEIVAALAGLRRRGFVIALDDFRPDRVRMPLIDHADIVKLDIRDLGCDLARLVWELHRSGLLVLAEKVETRTEFLACLRAGFDLFQGFSVDVPQIVCVQPEERPDTHVPPRWRVASVPRGLGEPVRL